MLAGFLNLSQGSGVHLLSPACSEPSALLLYGPPTTVPIGASEALLGFHPVVKLTVLWESLLHLASFLAFFQMRLLPGTRRLLFMFTLVDMRRFGCFLLTLPCESVHKAALDSAMNGINS